MGPVDILAHELVENLWAVDNHRLARAKRLLAEAAAPPPEEVDIEELRAAIAEAELRGLPAVTGAVVA